MQQVKGPKASAERKRVFGEDDSPTRDSTSSQTAHRSVKHAGLCQLTAKKGMIQRLPFSCDRPEGKSTNYA